MADDELENLGPQSRCRSLEGLHAYGMLGLVQGWCESAACIAHLHGYALARRAWSICPTRSSWVTVSDLVYRNGHRGVDQVLLDTEYSYCIIVSSAGTPGWSRPEIGLARGMRLPKQR